MAEVMMCWPLSWVTSQTPRIAKLFASVPPDVKTISLGRAPINDPTCRRDLSTLRVPFDQTVPLEAFRNSLSGTASSPRGTRGSTGVVAL